MDLTQRIQSEIRVIDNKMTELRAEKLRLRELLAMGELLNEMPNLKITPRNQSMLGTLAKMRTYLKANTKEKSKRRTHDLITCIRGTWNSEVNESTLRSYLKRFRESNYLHYDEKTKSWSAPEYKPHE